MSKDFLSQEEVDALLKGVDSEPAAEKDDAAPASIRPYNLASEERIVRGRMPALEIINERFARHMRTALSDFVRRSVEVAVRPVRIMKYSDFVNTLPTPANLNLVKVKPLRGTSLFTFDPNLVSLVVDSLFGGSGQARTRTEGSDFTPTEQRIIQRMLEVAFENLEKSWAAVHALQFEFVRREMDAQFASIAMPNEVVVLTTFNIEFGGAGGELHVCMPYSMLEPIRDVLDNVRQGDHMEADKRWGRLLSQQVQSAEVELVVNLGHIELTFDQLLGMQVGDVIELEIAQPIVAEVDEVPVMECKCGVFNGQYALRVEQLLPGVVQQN